MSVLQIVYVSRLNVLRAERDFELRQIQRKSEARNPGRQITGCLLVTGDMIVQLLEGPDRPLLDLFQRIRHDQRHQDVEILHQGHSTERHINEWGMEVHDVTQNPNSTKHLRALVDAYKRTFQFRLDDYLQIVHAHLNIPAHSNAQTPPIDVPKPNA